MDPARWARIEALCADALELPAAARAAFLDEGCGGDAALRREVESLVAEGESGSRFLERPLADVSGVLSGAPLTAIGPYRFVRRLGQGGMGEVYLAEREVAGVHQTVALKVVREGRLTAEAVGRFALERRILARLTHPNIARLLDAGTTPEGRPYYVMDYVDGAPVTTHCRERRLTIEARLRLGQAICDAVQYAHQNLVVHRDLKPSNILVDGTGVPKLLDFGIGKVLGDGDAFGTAVETGTTHPRTPAYAAPEQLRGEPVSAATDVYAIGVLLYELLAERHPFVVGEASPREVERAVLETTPPTPSTAVPAGEARRRLTGDLDNIVLKAMAKEPERRYPSAAALGEDLQRHLAGLPVAARPDTFGYRARKFVRRNRAWVATGVVALSALAVTMAVTWIQSGRVAREAARVLRERDKAIEVRGFLMEMLAAGSAEQALRDTLTARQMLDLQAARVNAAYAEEPELKAAMVDALADGYDRLGLLAPAESLANEALTIRRTVLGPTHPDVAASLNLLGWVLHERGHSQDAEPLLREAVALRRAAGPPYARDLARSLNDLGTVLTGLGRAADAEGVLREAVALRTAAYGPDHRSVGISASNLAAALYYEGKLTDAIAVQERAVDALTRAVGPDHQRSLLALSNLAAFKHVAQDWEGAEREYRRLLDRQVAARGRDHPLTTHVTSSLATVLFARARGPDDPRLAEAERLYRDALAQLQARLGGTHPEVGLALNRLANLLSRRARYAEASPLLERSVAILRGAYGEAHPDVANAIALLGVARWRHGEVAAAHRLYRRALAILDSIPGPPRAERLWVRATFCDHLFSPPGTAAEAATVCGRAEAELRAAPPAQRASRPRTQLRLAQALLALGKRAAADSLVAAVRVSADDSVATREDRELLGVMMAAVADTTRSP